MQTVSASVLGPALCRRLARVQRISGDPVGLASVCREGPGLALDRGIAGSTQVLHVGLPDPELVMTLGPGYHPEIWLIWQPYV